MTTYRTADTSVDQLKTRIQSTPGPRGQHHAWRMSVFRCLACTVSRDSILLGDTRAISFLFFFNVMTMV